MSQMKLWRLITYVLCFCILQLNVTAASWIKVYSKDGIDVFSRRYNKGGIYEFRGKGIIKAPATRVMALVQDIPKMPRWVEGCMTAYVIEKNYNSESFNRNFNDMYLIIFAENSIPWPFENRDYVLKGNVGYIPNTDTAVIDLKNYRDHRLPERKGVVRIKDLSIKFLLKPINDDKDTLVDFYVHLNPGGYIPNWAVNLMIQREPYKTLISLRKLAKYGPHNLAMEKLIAWHLQHSREQFKKN